MLTSLLDDCEYYVVGAADAKPDAPDCLEGRLIIFKVSDPEP